MLNDFRLRAARLGSDTPIKIKILGPTGSDFSCLTREIIISKEQPEAFEGPTTVLWLNLSDPDLGIKKSSNWRSPDNVVFEDVLSYDEMFIDEERALRVPDLQIIYVQSIADLRDVDVEKASTKLVLVIADNRMFSYNPTLNSEENVRTVRPNTGIGRWAALSN